MDLVAESFPSVFLCARRRQSVVYPPAKEAIAFIYAATWREIYAEKNALQPQKTRTRETQPSASDTCKWYLHWELNSLKLQWVNPSNYIPLM